MRRIGENDAARGRRYPRRLLGKPALPECEVQRRQLTRDLDVLDLHDRRPGAGPARVLEVRRQRVGLAARGEVRACGGEHARGCIAAVWDWKILSIECSFL